jgi:hypothetical protein
VDVLLPDVSDVCASPTLVAAGGTARIFHRVFAESFMLQRTADEL